MTTECSTSFIRQTSHLPKHLRHKLQPHHLRHKLQKHHVLKPFSETVLLFTEDEGKSTTREPTRSGEAAGRESGGRLRRKKQIIALLEILDEKSIMGASGVALGLPGDEPNLIRQVDLADDKNQCVVLRERLDNEFGWVCLDCDPRCDHDGRRFKHIGRPYDDFCRTYDIEVLGKGGNEQNQVYARRRLATRCGYKWGPFQTLDPDNTRA